MPACCADSGCYSHSMYLVSITVHAWELIPNAAKLHILLEFNFLLLVAHCSEVSIQGEGGPTHMNTYVHSHIHKCVCTHTHIHKFASMQYNTIQYNTIQYNTIQYNTIQYNTIQYNTLHYTTLHYTTLHYTTLHYTTIQIWTTIVACLPHHLP